MATDKNGTLQGALERFMSKTPQVEVTKMPTEEPKPKKGQSWENVRWPEHLHYTDKDFPWIKNVKADDEVILVVKAKVKSVTNTQDGKDSRTSATLLVCEVGRFSGL